MSQLTVLQAPGRCLTKIYGRDRKGGIVKRAYDNAALRRSKLKGVHSAGEVASRNGPLALR